MILLDRLEGIETVKFETDRIDALNVGEIKTGIMHLIEEPHVKVIIDLSGVEYLDSSGFGMLLHLLRTARSNYCTMKLCSLTKHVRTLFEALRLNTTFDIYPDLQACLESYRRGGPA